MWSACFPNRLENSRDDMRLRADILEREVVELQHRNEDLTSLAQEAQTLKDEMDILRCAALSSHLPLPFLPPVNCIYFHPHLTLAPAYQLVPVYHID